MPLDEFARMNRDFVALETNYLVERDIGRLAKAHALKYAFRYTDDLYFNRAASRSGFPHLRFPRRSRSGAAFAWRCSGA